MDPTLDYLELLRTEATQLREETGGDAGLAATLDALVARMPDPTPDREALLISLYADYEPVIRAADALPDEPSDLDAILAAAPVDEPAPHAPANPATLADRIHGAWLGRIAGCILGKPVEGFPKEEIDKVLAAAGETEVTDYLPVPSASARWETWKDEYKERSCRGLITRAEMDDDINYTVMALRVVEQSGRDFTPQDVMWAWLKLMPAAQSWTAERAAYRNFLNSVPPPESGRHQNPYREWIGAQIRTDFYGYINPGNPVEAARMAWRDACISHRKNGIYGAMWAAAMVAAAFTADTPEQAIRAGMAVIPRKSRLRAALEATLAWHRDIPRDWRACHARILDAYGNYHPVHTINNACLVALGLLYGEGDFGRTIGIAVHAGLDTDCNGATAGSVVGAMIGGAAVPGKWVDLFGDTVCCSLAMHAVEKISDLAARTARLAVPR